MKKLLTLVLASGVVLFAGCMNKTAPTDTTVTAPTDTTVIAPTPSTPPMDAPTLPTPPMDAPTPTAE